MKHFGFRVLTGLFLMTLIFQIPGREAIAAEMSGKVILTVGPYLLLETPAGKRAVRVDKSTAYGNLEGPGSLKQGGDRVDVAYDRAIAGVPLATTVTRETGYLPSGESSLPLEQLALAMEKGATLLVDARTSAEWEEARIPGAVLSTSAEGRELLLRDLSKDKQIVFYGSSPGDLRPFDAARRAIEKGFTDAKVLPGGMSAWRKGGKIQFSSPAYLAGLKRRGLSFRVLDLRDPAADKPILPGAEALPFSALKREQVFLPQRSYQLPLYLYGPERQAREAARQILAWGYHQDGDLAIIDSQIPGWDEKLRREGVAAVRQPEQEIAFEEFRALWEKGSPTQILLNVKPDRDRKTIEELHIPLELLPEKLHELPKDREIVLYCKLGMRSAVAYEILTANGFKVRFLNRMLQLDKTGNILQQP